MDRLDKGGDHDSFIFLTTFYKHHKENKEMDSQWIAVISVMRLETLEGFEISSSLGRL